MRHVRLRLRIDHLFTVKFEKLFGIDNLAQAKKDYQREGQIPKGSEIVDRIFNSN